MAGDVNSLEGKIIFSIQNKKNFLVKYQELIKLNENSDKQITNHYIELINLTYERLQDFNLKKTPLINGNICKVFN